MYAIKLSVTGLAKWCTLKCGTVYVCASVCNVCVYYVRAVALCMHVRAHDFNDGAVVALTFFRSL